MAFDEDIRVFVSELGPEASRMLAQTARDVKTEVESARPLMPLTHWATDGVANRPFDDVRPDGVIFEYWDYRSEIVAACFEELRGRSPVASGEYRDGFLALLDGAGLRPLEVPSARQLADIAEVAIVNPAPYARRLEVGLNKQGAPFVRQVSPHIVESAAIAIRRQFRDVVKISFDYLDLDNAYTRTTTSLRFAAQSRRSSVFRSGGRYLGAAANQTKGAKIRYPAILIRLA